MDPTPLPKKQLFLICAVRFAEPVSFTIHVPFIYFMIRDFNIGSESEIAYYASLITTCFALAQLISGLPFGMLSDRFGRRPLVLFGLADTIIGIILFGLSKSYAAALVIKIMCGLLDGNIAVLKSMVSELTANHSESQRAQAFSLLQIVFAVGSIVGAALGGYLSNPVQKYRNLFHSNNPLTGFLTEYPYFLPCFTAAAIATCGWIAGFLYLEETLVKEPLVREIERDGLVLHTPTVNYNTFNKGQSAKEEAKAGWSLIQIALSRPVIVICLLYGLVAYQMVFYDELFPIWSATKREDGGMGLDSKEIGTAISFSGSVTLFVQLFVLHRMTRWLGTLRLFQLSLFLSIFVFAFQGYIRYLYNIPGWNHQETKLWMWIGLLTNLAIKTFCQTVAMTGSIILVNNAAPRKDTLGVVNGFAQCVASGMRALGPASSGIVWSSTINAPSIPASLRSHICWIVLTCIGANTFFTSTRLDPKKYTPVRQ